MSKQPPRVQLNFEPDEIPKEVQMQVYDYDEDVIDNLHDDELEMPRVVGKPKVQENDIFDDIPDKETGEKNPNFIYNDNPSMNGMGEDLVIEQKPVKKEKVKKPRKPMSEEHKQKLGLAREKAMAVRKANAEEKKKMKALENEEIELLKAQKVKKVQKLKKEVEEYAEATEEEVIQKPQQTTGFTKKDLEDAQLDAIMKYETLRKKRKAEKRRQEQLEADKQNIIKQIQPQGYKYRDGSNKWDMCY
jgi:hypothetical protein